MSEPLASYPNLGPEHLEILPNLSNKIAYQDVPTTIPPLSPDQKASFLDAILKCFVPNATLEETKFHISFLENEDAVRTIKGISPQFSWAKRNQYTWLAMMNFIPDLCNSSTTSTRSSVTELLDLLNSVVNHESNQEFLEIMKQANPNQENWTSFDYFVNLCRAVSRTLFLSIAKMHSGIILNYKTFLLEAGLISLGGTHSQMVLGLKSKEDAMNHARELHQLREEVKQAYSDYLGLNNSNVLPFLKTIIPGITFTYAFDYASFKSDLLQGSFGNVFHFQTSPIPLSCPEIKAMSEELDAKVSAISAHKATEEVIQAKLAHNLKQNLTCQLNRWEENKISSSGDIPFLEVHLESLKSLKREAITLSTKIDWTTASLGINQLDLEKVIIEVSQALQEAKRNDRQKESKDRKLSDQISSTGPPLSLPKIHSPCDIIKWMTIYKKVIQFVHSDLTKLALIKNSLNSKDRKSTEHLNSVGGVINFINSKYCKHDVVLHLLTRQAFDLQKPWSNSGSLKNIETFLTVISNFFEWKLEHHLNSKFRDDALPLLFTPDTMWKFLEVQQQYEETLNSSDSPTPLLAICSTTDSVELNELQQFSVKLENQSSPEKEKKRLEFWLITVKKFSDQLRQLSLYSDEKNTYHKPKNSFFEQNPPPSKSPGGSVIEVKVLRLSKSTHDQKREAISVSWFVRSFQKLELATPAKPPQYPQLLLKVSRAQNCL